MISYLWALFCLKSKSHTLIKFAAKDRILIIQYKKNFFQQPIIKLSILKQNSLEEIYHWNYSVCLLNSDGPQMKRK